MSNFAVSVDQYKLPYDSLNGPKLSDDLREHKILELGRGLGWEVDDAKAAE